MHAAPRAVLLAALAAFSQHAPAAGSADAVLAADRAFATMSAERGQQAAFEEYLTSDAIVFRPGAVTAREWFATHEQGSGRLQWTPSAAASDCTGQWAVSTGPWTYSTPEGEEAAVGHYLSIWRREPGGDWRVVLDNGIDHPREPDPPSIPSAFSSLWQAVPQKACHGGDGATPLAAAEQDLNAAIRSEGLASAVADAAAAGGLAYRDDRVPEPIAASAAADAAFGRGSEARSQFVSVDPDSDFGYSYGVLEARIDSQASARAAYLRVWRREGRKWRLAIDMRTPLPSEGGQ